MEWPQRFYDRKAGIECPICVDGRPEETRYGIRFYAGELTDAYLFKAGVQRGLSHVYFHARHVVEPTELSADEATRFWAEVLHAGCAIERVFEPVKMNYNVLGNSVPHLHVHVIPRYAVDPKPEWPFPFPEVDPPPFPEDELRRDVERLREAAS
ncbi:MAG TPA: HIT family protein [Gaiellaceae bacterium]|nr:HIT family protein [Gaiellaceae bacterium]